MSVRQTRALACVQANRQSDELGSQFPLCYSSNNCLAAKTYILWYLLPISRFVSGFLISLLLYPSVEQNEGHRCQGNINESNIHIT